MLHTKTDFFDLAAKADLEREILVFEIAKAKRPRPIFPPHKQISVRIDYSIWTQPTADGLDCCVWIELIATKEGWRKLDRFIGLVQVRPLAKDAVAPNEHIVIFWKENITVDSNF